ncbi:MAG: Ig-like domain-containing protein, partial [Pseudomonadota bacterium]
MSDTSVGQSTKVNGTNAANTTTGTTTADKVDAKAGSDTGLGGAGDDWVKGGSGDDNVDGGAGSDRVDGGAGNDRLIYKVGENTGATDTYDGGSGTNRLVLQMTRAEWMRDDIQADVAAFLVYLATASTGTNSSKGFTFTAFKLTVTKVSALDVFVDGVQQDPRDEAITAVADSWLAATEHSSIAGNVVANDLVPDLVRAVEVVQGPAKGALALNADGSFVYNPGNDFNALAEGETAQATFTYKVTDADRDSTTAQVTLTITGTNDAPIANADTGTTNENDSITVNVLANDTDVDTSDTHTVKTATLTSGLGAVAVTNNQVQWTPGTAYDYLAVGETAAVGISYTQSDNHNASATSSLALTVKGTNDVPVANTDAAVTDENTGITVNVLGNDTDLDTSDTHTVKAVSVTTGLGGVAITNNQVQWTPGAVYDSLALGETATVAIAYTQSDNNNATA